MSEWWHTAKRTEPDRYPVDVTCPCCQRVLLGWASYRVVIVRKDAHCTYCNADIAVQTSVASHGDNADMARQVNSIAQSISDVNRETPPTVTEHKLAQSLLDMFRKFGGL